MKANYSISQDFIDSIEDRDELVAIFNLLEEELAAFKRTMAELWMFGTTDLTDQEYLSAYGLETSEVNYIYDGLEY